MKTTTATVARLADNTRRLLGDQRLLAATIIKWRPRAAVMIIAIRAEITTTSRAISGEISATSPTIPMRHTWITAEPG
jgi:hypothetical protein